MKNKKVIIIISIFTIVLVYIVYKFTSPSSVLSQPVQEQIVHDEYILENNYIKRYLGTTTPTEYTLLNDENIEAVFIYVESQFNIHNLSDLDAFMEDAETIQVRISDSGMMENFMIARFTESYENANLIYNVLKRNDVEYYINIGGGIYKDTKKTQLEYNIYTNADGIVKTHLTNDNT